MKNTTGMLVYDATPTTNTGPGTPAIAARAETQTTLDALTDFARELASRPKLPGLPTSENDAVTQVKMLQAATHAKMDEAIKEIIANELHLDPVDPANYPAGLQRLIATRPELAAAYQSAADGLTAALIPAYHSGRKILK
jgi:hypothetical protein